MIKFFRTIRKNRADAGKVKSYLVYAFGEIVLVVIGILIALQINNWNEDAKDRRLEMISYCKLLEDVTQDHALVKQLMKENQDRIEWANRSIHLLQQKAIDREALANAMRNSINLIRFNFKPSLSAFDDLKSSGKLAILKDLELKKKLLNYYAVVAGYGDIQDIVADASLESYLHPTKNFLQAGFLQIDFVKAELDTALVDVPALTPTAAIPEPIRQQFMNESILHLNQNARKKGIFELMEAEVLTMKRLLESKCRSNP